MFESSRQAVHKSVLFFILVNVFAVFQTWVISLLMARYFLPSAGWSYHSAEVAHGIGVIAPVFTSYFGHKYLSFKA